MYYICKFSDSWSLLDTEDSTSRPLKKNEIDALQELFPKLFQDNKILAYIEISTIAPNKLMKLTSLEKNAKKKGTDNPIKIN